MNDILRQVRRAALLHDGAGLTDSQLLECFLNRRDEAAFAALVRRHGPMVLGVCRRVLRHEQDAEDAFQATFLVLARRAAELRARELVGNWLYGVAYRTALRSRTMKARRRMKEQQARCPARADDGWQELLPLLDQELDRLPEDYRVAVVLCDLEGMTRREAARQLGVPEGTLSGRLTKARRLLARRLARYGLAVSGGALGAALSANRASACVPSTLAGSTARAAVLVAGRMLTAGTVPVPVMTLTESVVKTMFLSRLKAFVAVTFVILVSASVVGLAYRTGAAQAPQSGQPRPAAERPAADDLEALRLEVEALRKGLQATRERVKVLEGEVSALRASVPPAAGSTEKRLDELPVLGNLFKKAPGPAPAGDPLTEAEAALKGLREARDMEAQRRAADALDKALQHLKERDVKSPKKE